MDAMDIAPINEADLEQWSKSRPSFVLVNRAVNMSACAESLPRELLQRLDGARPDFLLASRDELDRIGIVLAHDQLARFVAGEPILIIVDRADHREALKRGRRQKDVVERAVQDALAVQTYTGVERLGSWLQARDGRRLAVTTLELRDRVLEMIADQAWLEDPTLAGPATSARRLAFFRTQFDAGSRLVSLWYPWSKRPDDLSKVARRIVKASAQAMDPSLLNAAIEHEIAIIRFTLVCLRRATTLVMTEHSMSEHVREHNSMTRHQQAMLGGAIGERPRLHQAVRAAIDGDFNPADLFRSLLSHSGTLELARALGKRGRGHDVRLEVGLVRELKRLMTICPAADASLQSEETLSDEQAAALIISQAAYELHPKSAWTDVLDGAIAAREPVVMTA